MRLWLVTPENEGGWKLPFWDSNEKKRGGIQVDDQAPVALLDAEHKSGQNKAFRHLALSAIHRRTPLQPYVSSVIGFMARRKE
ncbi:hypothetical protein ACN38_g3498 [Penicillium nordicum]|uniref:Uncharacterized protein n=1 Tax=Penicillium nordicum TaxID=229535 RepID=A0A0M8PC07_9EURO|nr:hypothetical protein ACN38_g3498 [Penicillium nordicum]